MRPKWVDSLPNHNTNSETQQNNCKNAHESIILAHIYKLGPSSIKWEIKTVQAPGGYIRRDGASQWATEAVRQAVGGGCQSGWALLLSVTNVIEAEVAVRDKAAGP